MKIRIFVAFLFFCLLLYFCYNVGLYQEKKESLVYKVNEYEMGYETGYNSAISQFIDDPELKVKADINKKYFSYTSSEIKSEESIKGYEDGYHKAVELMYCPQ